MCACTFDFIYSYATIDILYGIHTPQVEFNAFNCAIDKCKIVDMLSEIKSETKLNKIFQSPQFDRSLLKIVIQCSFNEMVIKFKQDCLQHNPHMNYLKIPLILKQALMMLIADIEWLYATAYPLMSSPGDNVKMPATTIGDDCSVVSSAAPVPTQMGCNTENSGDLACDKNNATVSHDAITAATIVTSSAAGQQNTDSSSNKRCIQLTHLFANGNFSKRLKCTMQTIVALMHCIEQLEHVCLIHIEAQFIEKFIKENVLKPTHNELFIRFSCLCATFVQQRILRSSVAASASSSSARDNNHHKNNENKRDSFGDDIVAAAAAAAVPEDANDDGSYNTRNIDTLQTNSSIIQKNTADLAEIVLALKCTDALLGQKYISTELTTMERQIGHMELMLDVVYAASVQYLASDIFCSKYVQSNGTIELCYCPVVCSDRASEGCLRYCKKAIAIAKLVELCLETLNNCVYANDHNIIGTDDAKRYMTNDAQYIVDLKVSPLNTYS